MPTEPKSVLISSIIIAIGGYYLPATVLFGAIVGASVFIMFRAEISMLRKFVLFVIAFICGVFAGADAAGIINKITPQSIELGEFAGAALAAALSVGAIETMARLIASFKLNFWHKEPPL